MFRFPTGIFIATFEKLNSDSLDDRFDRLNSAVSVYILLFFSIVAITKLYVGDQIQCMSPANTPSSWHDFYSSYCFIQPKTRIPEMFYDDDDSKFTTSVAFYPWVQFVMLVQALCFYLPKFYWNATASKFSIDLKSILKETKGIEDMKNKEEQDKKVTNLAAYVLSYLRYIYDSKCGFLVPKAVFFYITKKWLQFANAFIQFYFITHFVGEGDYSWGIESLVSIMNQHPWSFSKLFPRVVFCSINYVEDGQRKKRSMPCIFGMNVIFEKIFTFLYFWILFVMLVTFLDACYSLALFCFPAIRNSYFNSQLKKCGINTQLKFVMNFMDNVMHSDGLLMFKLVQNAHGKKVAESLLRSMWEQNENLATKTVVFNQYCEISQLAKPKNFSDESTQLMHSLDEEDARTSYDVQKRTSFLKSFEPKKEYKLQEFSVC